MSDAYILSFFDLCDQVPVFVITLALIKYWFLI